MTLHHPAGYARQHHRAFYIPCGEPAVAIVYHSKDRRGYYMCAPCADHNVRNRDGKLVARKEQ